MLLLPTFDFQPVIIIGAARSGTNMLRDTLARLGGVATWPCDEINYIWRHHWARFPTDELRPVHATPQVKRFVRTAFQRLARRTQARWVVEKTCANSLRIDFVRAIVPEAKFIVIVRDGRDVVASAVKRWQAKLDFRYTLKKVRFVPLGDLPHYTLRFATNRVRRLFARDQRLASWGPRFEGIDEMLATHSLAEVCAEQWSRCVTRAAKSLVALSTNHLCHVQYEEFVAHPEREFRRIAQFLDVSIEGGQLRQVTASISQESVGKWRRDLDHDTFAIIEPQIVTTLQTFREWNTTRSIKAAA